MVAFNRFRLFHWLLAGLFVAVYLSGDDAELLHIWLGYGLAALLFLRLLIAALRLRGFPRLTPSRTEWHKSRLAVVGKWLTAGALASFALASLIGFGMVDNGEVLAALPGVPADLFGVASDIDFVAWLGDAEEVHEFLANLALWLIGLHVGYVLIFRSKAAWPMLRGLPKPAPGVAPDAASAPDEFARLQVSGRVKESADACSFELRVPAEQRQRFAARPGQFLTLKVPCGEPPLLRCYSLSRVLSTDQPLRITVKRVAGGRASNWLLDNLQPGDSLDILPPLGSFTPTGLDTDLLLVGAGSGVTPLMAILQAVLAGGRGRICLFYANRDADSVIFAEELAGLQRRYPQRLEVRYWFDASHGVADAGAIADAIADWCAGECFICGPQPFMDGAREALTGLGVAAARIHLERFATPVPRAPQPVTAKPVSRLNVALDGRRHELDVHSGEVLLEAMEQAGLHPPTACRAGVCAACKCRVVSGSVAMRSNQALSKQQVRQGWTLACQAEPTSAELQVEY